MTKSSQDYIWYFASHLVYAILVIPGGYTVLDPYDVFGSGSPISARIIGFVAIVVPTCIVIGSALQPLTYGGVLIVNAVVWMASAVWFASMELAFKSVYGATSIGVDGLMVVIGYTGIGMIPFVCVQFGWLFVYLKLRGMLRH